MPERISDGMQPDFDKLRLDDQLCFALYAATNAITRAYRGLLGPLGLTYPQYLVMLVLWQRGASPVSVVANALQLGVSAVTPLVDQLATAGFVLRAKSPDDRRVVLVVPTQAGIELEHAASTAQQSVVCRTGLSDDGLVALRTALKDLAKHVTAAGVAAGGAGD